MRLKKLLSCAFSLMLVAGMVPVTALAQPAEEVASAPALSEAALEPLAQGDLVDSSELQRVLDSLKGTIDEVEEYWTPESWRPFKDARERAEAYLESLYDQEGNPTAENTVENQDACDQVTAALIQARKNLITPDTLEGIRRWDAMRLHLNEAFACEVESDYSASSWEAFTLARDAANGYAQAHPLGDGSVNDDFYQYRDLVFAYEKAAYVLGQVGTVNVSLKVIDGYGPREPRFARELTGRNGAYELTTTGGATLKDLLTLAGYVGTYQIGALQGTYQEAGQWFVVINGTVLGYSTSYDGRYRFEPVLYDYDYGVDWNDVGIKDGDEVVVVRAGLPLYGTYQGDNPAPLEAYQDQLKVLTFADNGDITVREGEAFGASVLLSNGYVLGQDSAGAYPGVNLVVFGPVAEDGTYPSAPAAISGETSNALGEVSATINAAGTYYVVPLDMRENEPGLFDNSTNDSPGPNASDYNPSLNLAGDIITLTVLPATQEVLDAAKVRAAERISATHAGCDEYAIGDQVGRELAAYDAATAALDTVGSLAEIDAIVAAYEEEIEAINQVLLDRFDIDTFRQVMSFFPDDQALALEGYKSGVSDLVDYLTAMYDAATGRQRDQFTARDLARYQAILAAECSGESGAVTFKVLLEGVSDEDFDTDEITYFKQVTVDVEWIVRKEGKLDGHYQGAKLLAGDFGKIFGPVYFVEDGVWVPRDSIEGQVYLDWFDVSLWHEYFGNLSYAGYRLDGGELNEAADIVQSNWKYIRYRLKFDGNWMTAGEHTITLVFQEASEVDQAISAAGSDLKAAYNGYSRHDYTIENWDALTAAYNDGVAAVEAAETLDVVDAAKAAALAAMAAVQRKSSQTLGSVHVIVENTTFPEGAFTDTIVEGDYELTESDTMMTMVLKALEEDGFAWGGTGGSGPYGYDITYLSGIFANGEHLSEFDGGGQSGWMGTLNDWFTNESFSMFGVANGKLGDGDVIRVMYTSGGLGADLGGTWDNNDTSLKSLDVSQGVLSPAFSGSQHEYTLKIEGDSALVQLTPTASNKNFLVKTFLNEKVTSNAEGNSFYKRTEGIPVKPGDVIYVGCGELAWPSMNNQAGNVQDQPGTWYEIHVVSADTGAAYVQGLIDKLPAAASIAYGKQQEVLESIGYIETSMAALSEAELAKLDTAKLAEAKAAAEAFEQVDRVRAAIDALDASDSAQAREVLAAYDALSDDQRESYLTLGQTKKMETLRAILSVLLGDVNGNGRVNIVDAQCAYDLACGAYGPDMGGFPLPDGWTLASLAYAANVNGDDAVDANDAFAIQRFVHTGSWS